jgi:type II secretory pathway pseudopilin PulG
MPAWKDRRRAQAGTTLIELLVSLMIVGLALVLIVGTFSTGLLDATIAKRTTTAQAVMQYELDQITGSQYNLSPPLYSECFATESTTPPIRLGSYQAVCPDQTYSFRSDVTWTQNSPSSQLWSVAVTVWPDGTQQVGSTLQLIKVNR